MDMLQRWTDAVLTYCPIHNSYAPCLSCLVPEVYLLVEKRGNNDEEFFYFLSESNDEN